MLAEKRLSDAISLPGHILALLQLIESNATPEIIRQSAAVHFKNIVKKAWDEANEVRLEVDVKLKLSIARVNHLLFS